MSSQQLIIKLFRYRVTEWPPPPLTESHPELPLLCSSGGMVVRVAALQNRLWFPSPSLVLASTSPSLLRKPLSAPQAGTPSGCSGVHPHLAAVSQIILAFI